MFALDKDVCVMSLIASSPSLGSEVQETLSWHNVSTQHYAGRTETIVDVICIDAEHCAFDSCFPSMELRDC